MYEKKIAMVVPLTLAGILILAILATISLTDHAFAQKKPTSLTIRVSPINTRNAASYRAVGTLTSDGAGVGGATITFTTLHNAKIPGLSDAVTLPDGTYFKSWPGPLKKGTVVARYAGDSSHTAAASIAIIKTCAPFCARP